MDNKNIIVCFETNAEDGQCRRICDVQRKTLPDPSCSDRKSSDAAVDNRVRGTDKAGDDQSRTIHISTVHILPEACELQWGKVADLTKFSSATGPKPSDCSSARPFGVRHLAWYSVT